MFILHYIRQRFDMDLMTYVQKRSFLFVALNYRTISDLWISIIFISANTDVQE